MQTSWDLIEYTVIHCNLYNETFIRIQEYMNTFEREETIIRELNVSCTTNVSPVQKKLWGDYDDDDETDEEEHVRV